MKYFIIVDYIIIMTNDFYHITECNNESMHSPTMFFTYININRTTVSYLLV